MGNSELNAKAKSAEEPAAIENENGIDISDDEAEEYFEQPNNSGELPEEELDIVAGGMGGGYKPPVTVKSNHYCRRYACKICGVYGATAHNCRFRNKLIYHKCWNCSYSRVVGDEYVCYVDAGTPRPGDTITPVRIKDPVNHL